MALVDRNRDIRSSIYKRVVDLFTAPPVATGLSAYTVYGEAELRQVQAKTLAPVRPCVFVVAKPVRPVNIALPLVVVETLISTYPFELGNTKGKAFRAWLHCFGRQKNEASLLASFLQENLKPLTIYEFTVPGAPAAKEIALVDEAIDILEGRAGNDDLRQQGATDHWLTVYARGQTRDV